MTDPLTPYDHQPPAPNGPDGRRPVRRDVLEALLLVVALAVVGLILGLVWYAAAPKVPLISDGSAIYLKDSEGEQAIGADGWFTLLGLAFGAVAGALVFWRRRSGGVALVTGLALGGLAASVVAWKFGEALGPTSNVVAHAKAVGVNKVFYDALELRAKGALLAWPIASVAVLLVLTGLTNPAPRPAAEPWPAWGDPRHGGPAPAGAPAAGAPADAAHPDRPAPDAVTPQGERPEPPEKPAERPAAERPDTEEAAPDGQPDRPDRPGDRP